MIRGVTGRRFLARNGKLGGLVWTIRLGVWSPCR